jgi:hypothetical protein
MKSVEFLSEAEKLASPERAAMLLQQNCKPYFAQAGGWNDVLYRGITYELKPIGVYQNRGKRRPVNTKPMVQALIDDYFMNKFGVRFRAESIFAVPDPNVAASYGTIYVVFPIGEFKYCWSPNVEDLFIEISDINHKPITAETEKFISQMMANASYQTTDLARALGTNSEIMINCKQYYMLDLEMYHAVLAVIRGRR